MEETGEVEWDEGWEEEEFERVERGRWSAEDGLRGVGTYEIEIERMIQAMGLSHGNAKDCNGIITGPPQNLEGSGITNFWLLSTSQIPIKAGAATD